MRRTIYVVATLLFAGLSACYGQTKAEKSAAELLGDVKVGDVVESGPLQLPVILWGGEAATWRANGGTTTTPNSIFGKANLNFKLVSGDDSVQQAKDYLTGKSPFFRGTFSMCSVFAEKFNEDPRTKPVMILQLSYSQGDHMVAREGIKTLNDLKGKTICLQGPGPHISLVQDSLSSVGLSWNDVNIKWAKDLTGPNGPAEMMRKDESIDVACVITPDMIGLCSGIDQKGSGAEGTIKGASVVNSTATMSRSIADVYVCRSDYFSRGKLGVQQFVAGYLKATEEIVKESKQYTETGKAPAYVTVMKQMQQFFGSDALPTIEEDVHGLILDCRFARIPGNEVFFNDPNNLVGFEAKQASGLDMSVDLGYSTEKFGFAKAGWDYIQMSSLAGTKYTTPTFAKGRIKAEITDFAQDLDSSTIFTFEIFFEPGQKSFPIATYASDFARFAKAQAQFGNSAIVIEGHSDPTLALQNFYWSAKAKGLLTGSKGAYKFKGAPITLENTASIVSAIQSENLAGAKRQNNSGQMVEIEDPRNTVQAAQQLSRERAENVKKSIEEYAKENNLQIDLTAALPNGVGIADPVRPRPRNMEQAKENMRVVFRVVSVKAEAISDDDFNFEE